MKIIALLPVKNEVDILPSTLNVLDKFCDVIIIADQMSTDGSRDVYKRFKKVLVIDNHNQGHSNLVRWKLLEEARKYDGNNFILAVDADEFFPPELFKNFLNDFLNSKPGTFFAFPWIQLWKSSNHYNDGGAWHDNLKIAAFVDDRKADYERCFVINDHTIRLPMQKNNKLIVVNDIPLMHLQFVYWNRTQIKQAWYRCAELINKPNRAFYINKTYSVSMDNDSDDCKPINSIWLSGVELPNNITDLLSDWHLQEILKWFDKYGIEFFEPLQIWHIPELKARFVAKIKRDPDPEVNNFIKSFLYNSKKLLIMLRNVLKGSIKV